jgi:coproporphyrinogen III oxidase
MKTGRPEYYIPSPTTVSRDVKQVFVNVRRRIAKMLREHDGQLNFATDAWTSPNHKAFVAITVHFEVDGMPMSMLLDLKEVATSHSGVNLAAAFAQIMDEFGISAKVRTDKSTTVKERTYLDHTGTRDNMRQCIPERHND